MQVQTHLSTLENGAQLSKAKERLSPTVVTREML